MVLGRRLDSPLALPWPLSVDVIFGSPPPGLSKIRGVIAVEVQGTGACCHVVGSLEPLLGGAGRLEVGPTDRPRRQLTPPWCQPSSASRPTRLVAPALVATRSHLLERHGVGDRSSAVQRGGRSGAGRWRGRGGGGRRCRGGLVCQGEQRPGTADRFEGAPERCCARAGG